MMKRMRIVFLGRVNETYLYHESVTENCLESRAGRLPGVSRWSLTRSLPLVAYLVYLGTDVGVHGENFKSVPLNLSPKSKHFFGTNQPTTQIEVSTPMANTFSVTLPKTPFFISLLRRPITTVP